MSEYNLFWPVYKNLEKEVLGLTKYIHIDDNQQDVYSMHIAELIIRCAIEIESLAKELYWINGGSKVYDEETGKERDLYFDTDCMNYLNNIWGICKKKIIISCIDMYFKEKENKIIAPLHKAHKRGSSGAIWNKAYQAVKHDRKNSLAKATIKNLLHALGALYILNLYYKDDVHKLSANDSAKHVLDKELGSEIFAVTYADATEVTICDDMTDNSINEMQKKKLETSICIIKYSNDVWKEIHKEWEESNNRIFTRAMNSPEVREYLAKHPDYKANTIVDLLNNAGGIELVRKVMSGGFGKSILNGQREIVMNKAQVIYS